MREALDLMSNMADVTSEAVNFTNARIILMAEISVKAAIIAMEYTVIIVIKNSRIISFDGNVSILGHPIINIIPYLIS